MIQINIYKSEGQWYGARWIDGDYDGCDELSCAGDASEAEAIACAASEPIALRSDSEPRSIKLVPRMAS